MKHKFITLLSTRLVIGRFNFTRARYETESDEDAIELQTLIDSLPPADKGRFVYTNDENVSYESMVADYKAKIDAARAAAGAVAGSAPAGAKLESGLPQFTPSSKTVREALSTGDIKDAPKA